MIEARALCKEYHQAAGPLTVLKDVSLTVREGEFMAVVGPSGAGKSTLLHILGGLDRPSSGSVLFEGEDLFALKDARRAAVRNQKVGFVFQFYHLLPEFTALENVLLPGLVKRQDSEDAMRAHAMELLRQVSLEKRGGHRPYQLSGGEQQRVAIARALFNRPKAVFCDEPTGNLDSSSGKAIIELLHRLNKENGQTFVIVTHDENIARVSDRVLHIKDGVIE